MYGWPNNTVPSDLNGIVSDIDTMINKIEETLLSMENTSLSLLQNDEDKNNINTILDEYNELSKKIKNKIIDIDIGDKTNKNELTNILKNKSTLLDKAYNKINSSIDNKNTENYDKQFFMGGLNSKKLIQNLNENFEELINTYEFYKADNKTKPNTNDHDNQQQQEQQPTQEGNPISTLSNDISNLDDDNCKSFLMELIINCIESTTVLAEAQDQSDANK